MNLKANRPLQGISLTDLPTELVTKILLHLELRDLLCARRLNRFFDATIQETPILIYSKELKIAALEDNPNSRLTTPERIDALRLRENAWAKLEPRFTRTFAAPLNATNLYDIQEGYYTVYSKASPEGDATLINYLELPSTVSEECAWKSIRTENSVIDFVLSVAENDLAAVVTFERIGPEFWRCRYELNLLRFSTGRHHDVAQRNVIPILENISAYGDTGTPITIMEVTGDILVLVVNFQYSDDDAAKDELLVLNWKSGFVLMHRKDPRHTYNSVAFLSRESILIPNAKNKCLDIWKLSPQPIDARPYCSLGLPALSEEYVYAPADCRAEPNSIRRRSCSKRPFFPSMQDSVVLIRFKIYDENVDNFFSLLTHREALLSIASRHFPLHSTSEAGVLPWEQWGPRISRWVNSDEYEGSWITVSCGHRFIQIDEDSRFFPSRILVQNFNPYQIRKAIASPDFNEGDVMDGESEFIHYAFQEYPKSSLPCISTYSTVKYTYDGVLLDDERIVGVQLDENEENVASIDVLYFG